MKHYRIVFFAFVIAIFFSIPSSLQAGEYTNIDIGFPDTMYQSVTIIDINNTGQLICRAGFNSQSDFFLLTSVAGVWNADLDADGGNDLMTKLTPPDSFTFQFTNGAAAINDSGQIVGYMRHISTNNLRGFLWENGVFTILPKPLNHGNLSYSWATDINNSGQIVGGMGSYNAQFQLVQEGYMWDNGTITQLGEDFYVISSGPFPLFINDNSEVTGTTGTPASETSIWRNGVTTNLGNLGANPTIPEGMNNLGQVIGRSIIPAGGFDGFIWESGVMNVIAPNSFLLGKAINNNGEIIGLSNDPNIGDQPNLLWLPEPAYGFEAGVHNLELLIPQAPQFDLFRAADINDSGIIAVNGNFGTFAKINAWLMIPVPPPTITVNSVGDAVDNNPGDGLCNTGNTTTNGDPECTMRAALMESNALTDNVTIEFDIPVDPIIQLNTALPYIDDTVYIDGYSQPGNVPVLLDGLNAGSSVDGLVITSDAVWVEGLFIGRFDGNGILMLEVSNCKITGCTIGFSDTTNVNFGNGFSGISLIQSSKNIIGSEKSWEKNFVSNNQLDGISITGISYNNMISNNIIGESPKDLFGNETGNELGNVENGIYIGQFADSTTIGFQAESNSIRGNNKNGIHINGADYCIITSNEIIENKGNGILLDNASKYTSIDLNKIGTSFLEDLAGNLGNGIEIQFLSDSNQIGTKYEISNYIKNNGANGIKVQLSRFNIIEENFLTLNELNGIHLDSSSMYNRVIRNKIGIDEDGFGRRNKNYGIVISAGSDSNFIGGGAGIVDSSNQISENLTGGMKIVNSAYNQINGNEFALNGGPGLRLDSSSQHNVVIRNKIGIEFIGLEGGNLDDGVQILNNSDSNFIGMDNETGNTIMFNFTEGIDVRSSEYNMIRGNIISLNYGTGLLLDSSSQYNVVSKNKIGLDSVGAFAGNEKDGILISNLSNSNLIGGDRVDGNIISANLKSGISIDTSNSNFVQGNIIGLDTTGLIAMGNKYNGVAISRSHWTVVGTGTNVDSSLTGAGNLISANDSAGVVIYNNSLSTWVTSNIIGRGLDTVMVHPNTWGINVFDSPNTYIGGRGYFEEYLGNYILNNRRTGISLLSNKCIVDGNYIWSNGSDPQGGNGVYIKGFSNFIGGDTIITANSILNNNGIGVFIDLISGTFDDFNSIRFNSISGNLFGGIDLHPSAQNPNDTLDIDGGPNAGQNKPEILTSILTGSRQIAVTGTLISEPNQKYLIDFYSNTDCDFSGLGQGEFWLVSDTIQTDNFGFATFYAVTTNFAGTLPLFITSTATNYYFDNTSEFSNCNEVVVQNVGVDLFVNKTDDLDSAVVDTTIQYQITVVNIGSDDAANVILRDSLPSQLTYISDSTTIGNCTELDGIVHCNLGTLSSGASATITVLAFTVDSGLTKNKAIVSSDEIDIQPLNNSSTDSTFLTKKILTDITDEVTNLPTQFELAQNYPNPFNPSTEISFSLPTKSHVTIEVFNIVGQKVKTLIDGQIPAGYHTVSWNGKNELGQPVSSGLYLYKFTSENNFASKKMLLLK